jgi:chromosome segregation ATPase
VTSASRELARAQGDLDRRVGELASRTSSQATESALAAEQRIQETLGQARSGVTALEEQLHGNVAAFTGMVEAQRAELETALDGRMREELSTVATVVDEMGLAQAQLARQLDTLVQQVAATEARIDDLASSTHGGASRLHALEQRMQESVHRLTGEVRAQREAVHALVAPAPARAPVAEGAGATDLLDDLERQLQQAESRLARLGDVG